jgi:hypothetical protein
VGTYAARGRIEDKDGGFTDLLAEVVVEAASNTAPDAQDDAASTDEDVLVTIQVLANDTDTDGDTLVVDSVMQPTNGTIVNNGAEITYTPSLNFNGMDSFDYTVIDGSGGSDTATVNITVNPVNDTPVIESPGDQSNIEGDLVSLSVLASDPDGDVLTFNANNLPAGLSIDAMTGVISGNVAVGSSISSPYSVLLTVTDRGGLSASAAISWIIDPLIASPLPVIINIKPGVPPNCINNNGQGVIPVAILSSTTFDATQVDPASVQLQGLQVRAVGNPNNLQAYIEDANGDGLVDLVVQIDNGFAAFASGDTMATLTAYLFDGRAVSGSDTICVVP